MQSEKSEKSEKSLLSGCVKVAVAGAPVVLGQRKNRTLLLLLPRIYRAGNGFHYQITTSVTIEMNIKA